MEGGVLSQKRIPIVVSLLLAFTVFSCSRHPTTKIIAIATLMSHPALDEVQLGLKQELSHLGYSEGQDVRFIERNANGQIQMTALIANDLSQQNPDVIVAITTPMAQSVVKVARCPVVFAAVTDPVGAGILPSWTAALPTITGTSDAWPYEDQVKLIRDILPNARRIGVIYNPGEAAAQYGIHQLRLLAPRYNFNLVEGAVASSSDVSSVARTIAPHIDVFLITSDNTVISGVAGVLKVSIDQGIPLFAGDAGTVSRGALATVSVGYRVLGERTADLVGRALRGERNIPMFVGQGSEIAINLKSAELMKVTIPGSVLNRAGQVFKDIRQ